MVGRSLWDIGYSLAGLSRFIGETEIAGRIMVRVFGVMLIAIEMPFAVQL